MKIHKINPLPYILFFIIIILAIITFRDQIRNYSNSNANNNSNNESILELNTFTKATVKRVVDGDTIVVLIGSEEYKVRLIGVNSPESTTQIEEYGIEASNYTKKMLTGKTVYLEKDVSETDKYSRLLRYIWLQVPAHFSEDEIKEKMFNSILVLNGYAQAATYPPDVKYTNYFNKFENTARNENLGLWKYK